jgi:methionine synthase II (cobalamin-independent)
VKFLKTVVGSLPPKKLPIEEAIRWAVDIQLKHRVDIISDGEQRADMIRYFSVFPGLAVNSKGVYIKSQVSPLDDQKTFSKINDLHFVRNYLDKINQSNIDVKVTVTGPITLGFACAVKGTGNYRSVGNLDLYLDFAYALNPLIKEIAQTDCYLQIDEPSLSIGVINPKESVRIVNEALEGLSSDFSERRLSVHICGQLNGRLVNEIVKLNTPVLSLAFSASEVEGNIDLLSKTILKENAKEIGVGCVSVQATTKESVEEYDKITKRIEKIESKIGGERIAYLHPDCGLRDNSEEVANTILDRLSSSVTLWMKSKTAYN